MPVSWHQGGAESELKLMQKSEKYIIKRKSTRKGHEGETTAYVVFIPLKDGTKYNKSFPVKNYKSEAACKRAALKERDMVQGKLAMNETVLAKKAIPTVDDLFEEIPTLFKRRKGSLVKYRKEYNKWIKPKFGQKPITEVTKIDVVQTLNDCAESCTRQQVSNIKTIWKKIYGVAIDGLALQIKDCSRVEMPSCDHQTTRSTEEQNITEEAFQDFCNYMAGYGHYMPKETGKIYDRNIMLYALRLNRFIGVRPMEVRAICRDCIHFMPLTYIDEAGTTRTVNGTRIAIIRSVGSSSTEEVTVRRTKTVSSPRFVYLGEEGTQLLKEILAYSKYDLIFADYEGKPISSTKFADYIRRVKKQWWKDTGHSEDIYSEVMRKSLAADSYALGINPTITKKMMGHKNEDMSLNWYSTAPESEVVSAFLNRKFKE